MNRQQSIAAVLGAVAAGLRPDPIVSTADWTAANLMIADGPFAGAVFDPTLVPYAREITDEIDRDGVNVVSVRKSSQIGFTTIAIGWLGKVIDKTPTNGAVIFPTIQSVHDFNAEKFVPSIMATPALSRRVKHHVSRSGDGSTARRKRFPSGSMILTGANSAADLRSKTHQIQFRDEVDEWPRDLDGQGDPQKLADARFIAYHATGDWKCLEGSTPTIVGLSRIDEQFEAGDQRYFNVPCPHCDEFQRLEFGGKDSRHGLKFNTAWPYNAHYICKNGCIIEHHEKRAMLARGKFVASVSEPGRHPSFHIDALTSNLTTWDKIAETFLKSKDSPDKLKAFVNTWLGQSWEERGDAPDWKVLVLRLEDYKARSIPPGGLILTAAADVQSDGLYYEVLAWGADLQTWSIDVGFIPGQTSSPSAPAWRQLEEIYRRNYPDAYGGTWPIDAFAVDAGYNTQAVYQWCRGKPNARAIKGVAGWYRPAIASAPSKQDVDYGGRKVKRGIMLWPVGTWTLKAPLFDNLRKEGARDGAEADPPGYCHFTRELHDETYFRQLTNEHLKTRVSAGRTVREWLSSGPNHYHDVRIYNQAMAEHLALPHLTADQWRVVAQRRGVPKSDQEDLFARRVDDDVEAAPPPRRRRRVRGRMI